MTNKKIFIIAGEASSDRLGGKLIDAIVKKNSKVEFFGVGGTNIEQKGIKSLFPMIDLSVMGFAEVVPKIPLILKRIKQTCAAIINIAPDIVITIDSPGFNFRVAKRLNKLGLRKRGTILLHYVAPTVWAYKPERAKTVAKLYDHLITILPFESTYFDKENLANTYIGHPVVEDDYNNYNEDDFRTKFKIDKNKPIICVMVGSRITEIKRLLPIFADAINLFSEQIQAQPVFIFPTLTGCKEQLQNKLKLIFKHDYRIIYKQDDKNAAFKVALMALCKSGTSSLELAYAKTPMIVAHRINPLSAFIIKRLIRIKYVSLINILNQKAIIPELLQQNCNKDAIAHELLKLYNNDKARKKQLGYFAKTFTKLGAKQSKTPSDKAAELVLLLFKA